MPVSRKNVGATGKRRIVPIVGIDLIAGNLAPKRDLIFRGTDGDTAVYGARPASIGGRTRRWSTINFMQVNPSNVKIDQPTAADIQRRQNFNISIKSMGATLKNLQVLTTVQSDYAYRVVRQGVDPYEYATLRGWVMAVRYAQLRDGQEITATTDTWTFPS